MTQSMQRPGEALIAAGIKPGHPGPFFQRRVMDPRSMDIGAAAEALGLSEASARAFVEGRVALERDLAERVAAFAGNSTDFWMNMQSASELRPDR